MRCVALIVAILVFMAAPAWVDIQDGWEAYERGDYATTSKELRPLAGQGNTAAEGIHFNRYR